MTTYSFTFPPNTLLRLRINHNHSLTSLSLCKSLPKPTTHCFSSPSSHSRPDSDSLWLREEQRWLREEQRWLREEQRWHREREALLAQIHALNLRIQALENRKESVVDAMAEVKNVAALLQVLEDKNLLVAAESATKLEEEEVKEVVAVKKKIEEKKMTLLRKGSEGEEVREMQEALQKLGFYSGEEDMEFSSFSSGTERAVKTWQSTLGAPEDGIMTAELLERLYIEQQSKNVVLNIVTNKKESTPKASQKEHTNGSAVASRTKVSEMQQKIVKERATEFDASQKRVFLIGENRWEEPSRLVSNKKVSESKPKDATTYCLACRGEGRLMCTECDGTGEPNIEPQFLEWIDENAKCPYCEGLGYTICDVCEGKTP